jgi:hypothetical protein
MGEAVLVHHSGAKCITTRLPASYREPDVALCPGCVGAPAAVYRADQFRRVR